MCILQETDETSQGDQFQALNHQCIPTCPLCWFLIHSNIRLLLLGSTLILGTFIDIVGAAEQGCFLCLVLGQIFERSEYGRQFVDEAVIEAKVEGRDRDEGELGMRKITFMVRNPWDWGPSGGRGNHEGRGLAYSFVMGVASKGGPADKFIKQRPADPSVSSPEAFETARRWIRQCLETHEECPKKNEETLSILPTRVLDVGNDLSYKENIKLRITNSERGDYAALSYCWGRTTQILLNKAMINSFINGIEIESLPKTLQDAISATRELGIPYLWIDSLCIIQDDIDDKDIEITKMPQIYKNATVTLSAASAIDCGSGFLEDRVVVTERQQLAFCLPLIPDVDGIPQVQDKTLIGSVFLYANSDLGNKVNEFLKEPINGRAWTMQEAWLSARLLIYGSGPLQWRCLSKSLTFKKAETASNMEQYSEYWLQHRNKFFDIPSQTTNTATEIPSEFVAGSQSYHKLVKDWESLVSQYTNRSLTFSNDKLPALSGVAAEFNRLLGDIYLAGLWKSTLPYGLLWHRLPVEVPQAESTYGPEYLAPSWSFASRKGAVSFDAPAMWDFKTQVRIQSAETMLATPAVPFGRVTDGRIKLTGPMRYMQFEDVVARFVMVAINPAHVYWDYIVPDGGEFDPDFIKLNRMSAPQPANEQYGVKNRISIIMDPYSAANTNSVQRAVPAEGKAEVPPDLKTGKELWFLQITWDETPAGLVLLQVGEEIFRRVGYFKLGRNQPVNPDALPRPVDSTGPRWWDWEEGLKMCTATII